MTRGGAAVAAAVLYTAGLGAQGAMPPPVVRGSLVRLSPHTWVLPDPGVPLVPNIGVVVGRRAVLVVDTGMGQGNARAALAEVAKVGGHKRIYLAPTHAHAEHVSGLGAFPAGTVLVTSRALARDLEHGEAGFKGMAAFSPAIGEMLRGATLRAPDIVFESEHVLDLGGVRVRLIAAGSGHSEGDTLIVVEGEGVVFAGDLAPRGRFPSFSPTSTRTGFLGAMARVEALRARVIVPSHGPYGDDSIFPGIRRALDEIALRVAPLKAQGRSADDVVRELSPDILARYPAWPETFPGEVERIIRGIYRES